MGFSIGSFLKTIAGPVIGGLIGGPAGALIGSSLTSSFGRPNPQGGFPSIPGPTIFGGSGAATLPGGTGMIPLQILGGALTIAGILALSRNNTGRPASARKIREAARVCSLEVAASTFGITITQVCQVIIAKPRRRGRGISAADMRRTRSTIRKISTLQHNIARLVAHTKGKARGAGGRFI